MSVTSVKFQARQSIEQVEEGSDLDDKINAAAIETGKPIDEITARQFRRRWFPQHKVMRSFFVRCNLHARTRYHFTQISLRERTIVSMAANIE